MFDLCLLYLMQGRFDMEEEWKKAVIMKQMCNIFRGMKSRLVTKVRAAETAADILALKPSNIPSIQVWNSWVKSKTSKAFTVSMKFICLYVMSYRFNHTHIYNVGSK